MERNAELTLTVNSPTSSRVKIVHSRLMSSASGTIGSQEPAISKSYNKMLNFRGN